MKRNAILKLFAATLAVLMLCACSNGGGADIISSAPQSAADQPESSQTDVSSGSLEGYPASPEWAVKLPVAAECEQFIAVAGVDKTTAYITMHQKDEKGVWHRLIATPGFIGKDGLGEANVNDCYTPVGTFTIDKAFGIADDPGCAFEYTKVDGNYYWSGDGREGKRYNELVSIKDIPDLDTENSERIVDYPDAYAYVLNMGYNSECVYEKGFAFFFHCFRENRTYTGGCVAIPEEVMKTVMQLVKPGCKITINYLTAFGGSLDD